MNLSLRHQLATLMLVALILSLLAPTAQAQLTPNTTGTFSGVPLIVNDAATTNINSTGVSVRKDRGLAVLPFFAATNSSTANVIFTFDVSADGTNYTTTAPLSFTNVLNGTTAVRGYYHFTPAMLNNVRTIRLRSIQNVHTATIRVTNVTWSVSN